MASQAARISLKKLKQAGWNPRVIDEPQMDNLVRALQADPEFMEMRPILAMADGTVYAGNQRLEAARRAGWKTVWAIVEDVPEQFAKERAIRDNQQWGEWADVELARLIKELLEADSDTSQLGFDSDEVSRLAELADAETDGLLYTVEGKDQQARMLHAVKYRGWYFLLADEEADAFDGAIKEWRANHDAETFAGFMAWVMGGRDA